MFDSEELLGVAETSSSAEQTQFTRLFLENQRRVYYFIASIVPHWVDAEEIFQQTSLTLWERWEQFDGDRDFAHWAFGIAVNHVRNHVRKKQHHQIAVQEQLLTHLAAYHAEQQSLFDDLHENLRGCLDKLPANQRHILSCFYDEEASPMQIARAEGKTSNAIYKLLKKIRQTLYECLTKNVAEWRLS